MNIYVQYILAAGGLGTAFGIAFAYFFRGKRTESGEIISFYKEQAENYKTMMHTKEEAHAVKMEEVTKYFTEKVNELTKELGVLQGQYTAEKNQREQYELILKDKNPETEAFMKMVTQACNDQSIINKEVVSILKDIHTMQKAEHDRDFKIESTVTKTN